MIGRSRSRWVWLVLACALPCALTAQAPRLTHTTPSGSVHQLVLVPEGPFMMGRPETGAEVRHLAEHEVYLDAYYIDLMEVTRGLYVEFLNAMGTHTDEQGRLWARIEPYLGTEPSFRLEDGTYTVLEDSLLPAAAVLWWGADAYCRWAGLRLPTEAEWEKAARGTDARDFPWGPADDRFLPSPDRTKANWGTAVPVSGPDASDGYLEAAPVGSFPDGASPYGLLDMAGNIWEWVADWYSEDYYLSGATVNPQGPATGRGKGARGGSWLTGPVQITTWDRGSFHPNASSSDTGFRCARDVVVPTGVPPRSWGRVKSQR